MPNSIFLFIFKKMELHWKCLCTFWDLTTCNRYCKTFWKYWPWPRSILHISIWNNATFKDCYNFRMFIFYWKCAENNNFDMCIQLMLTRYDGIKNREDTLPIIAAYVLSNSQLYLVHMYLVALFVISSHKLKLPQLKKRNKKREKNNF